MRWKPKENPLIGSIRFRKVFLWFPHKDRNIDTNQEEWRWLEFATFKEQRELHRDGPCWMVEGFYDGIIPDKTKE